MQILDAATGKELRRIQIHPGSLNDLKFSPDGKRLATAILGAKFSAVKIWDATTGKELLTLQGLSPVAVRQLTYSADGTRLAAFLGGEISRSNGGFGIGDYAEVAVWDTATGKQLYTLKGLRRYRLSMAFSPDGRRLATASGTSLGPVPDPNAGWAVKIWDATTGNELLTLRELGSNQPDSLAFSSDGSRLYAAGPSRPGPVTSLEIRVWDATPRQEGKQP